ncbi:hypothetical protein LTR62_004963 [Meristemomyces frigidus]|uniref:Uncharacterized protein n=1 Tax=Meristemomyces frigidus TaxID=1508187 RepID=A0AAN7YTI3_9PEZI|nr:hypothetical protein LTR62_004963 [Meristemomyces frigidus]
MAPSRFKPEPYETTTKSSKDVVQQTAETETKPKVRRFAVEPVETSATSSKERKAEVKSEPRRFAVEPIETEHKSSKDRAGTDSKPRRFAVEPLETEHKSSKDTKGDNGKPIHIKFLPQPVETIYRTRRKSPVDDDNIAPHDVGKQRTVRKFAPILIDTAQRSRRAGDDSPVLDQADKTESGHNIHAREHRRHIRGDHTPLNEVEDGVAPDEHNGHDIPHGMRRQLAPLDGSAPLRSLSVASTRSHSFRCPELDTIESSESERGSIMSSLSSSPEKGSPMTAPDTSIKNGFAGQKHATRIRESVDESFTHYLLQLEAQKAQQRLLRELAADAFPNSDYHEPVQHYMDIDEGSDEMEIEDRPVTYDFEDEILLEMAARRESTAKVNWEQVEMQRHAEQLEQERNAAMSTKKRTEHQSPWWAPPQTYGLEKQDEEMRSMRDRARPPMLGDELVFPRCPSPEPARFDVTQGSTVLRSQMCYLTEHAQSQSQLDEDEHGLWSAPPEREVTITSAAGSAKGTQDPKGGLWGGFCVADELAADGMPLGLTPASAFTGPTGLLTPAPVTEGAGYNPFEQSFANPSDATTPTLGIKTPPTPPRSLDRGDSHRIDSILTADHDLDRTMEADYPPSFITQIYNYLSLGYPSLARPFDEELSKITSTPIAQLRQDDAKARSLPRGYIRLGEDFEGGGGDVREQDCVRWRALRLYVREWARQEKDMVPVDRDWGGGARRGSWAI